MNAVFKPIFVVDAQHYNTRRHFTILYKLQTIFITFILEVKHFKVYS